MSWEDILKRIEVLPENKVEDMAEKQGLKWESSKEKGYPVSNLTMVVDIDDEDDSLRGYTSFKDMGKYYFVGNGYSYQKGAFGRVVPYRNDKVVPKNMPKIVLVNPIEGASKEGLMRMVARGGGIEVKDYSMVDDIMSEKEYERLIANPNITMARYPPLKLMKWEETLKASKKKARRKKKKSNVNAAGNYTKPALRRRLFYRIKASNKGGRAGQWSARKAQRLALAYEKAGGGYRN